VLNQILLLHLSSNPTQRLHRFVSDASFLNGAERLQRRKKHVSVFHASHVGNKYAQFLGHCEKHFIVIVVVLAEKRNQFLPRSLLAKRARDRGEPSDRVQPQLNILVLQLIDQYGNRIQRLVHHRHVVSPDPRKLQGSKIDDSLDFN